MPQSEWQRIYGRFEAMGDFSPVVFWLVGFLLLQTNPPAGHTQRSDRRAIGAKGKEFLMNFNTSEVADVIRLAVRIPYGNPFREISAVCCHRHGIPSMPASRLFPKGEGEQTKLEKGESRILCSRKTSGCRSCPCRASATF